MRVAIHVREVKVPDFRGKTPAEARLLAENSGLALEVESNYYSAGVPAGRVLSQGPAPGAVVRRGWQVQVALSLGPQRVTIPEVIGESERAAAISIAERGLQLSSSDEIQLSTTSPGQVVAQNPGAHSKDVSAPRMSILVAQSPSPQAFVMPSFIGQPLGSVTNTLKDAGFSVGKVTEAAPAPASSSPFLVPGTEPAPPSAGSQPQAPAPATQPAQLPVPISPASLIIAQNPPPGRKVLAGAAIDFVVR